MLDLQTLREVAKEARQREAKTKKTIKKYRQKSDSEKERETEGEA